METRVHSFFRFLGWIGVLIFGIWDLRICYSIVNQVAGSLVAYLGFIIAPVVFAVAPWYALIAWGKWFPLVIIYGGGILVVMLFKLGKTPELDSEL
jgi:putative effector of murein hydrolase LrgA (UPF0299 family)